MEYTGYCTYYDLPGRMTASGENFNANAMTCAMTREKAQLGTIVKPRPLRPDPGIIIDLTPAAFRAMVGSLGPGKVYVRVTVP